MNQELNAKVISPARLAWQLAAYFAILLAVLIVLLQVRPEIVRYLPVGGTDALSQNEISELADSLTGRAGEITSTAGRISADRNSAANLAHITLFVLGHLTGTTLIMLPIARTYRAMNHEAGFSKTFVRALIVLPICATTIVLLIQDSLALAFGLAALVAAVRFRVTLDEAMDGIFIFAAICVGLAAGIGYLGVAYIMSVFFCFANLILWMVDYGRNPLDDMRRQKKRDKLGATEVDSGPSAT